jgi:hypothetical protein
VGRLPNRWLPLKYLMIILILVGVRRVVMWMRRGFTNHRCLIGVTLLGGPRCILSVFDPFLRMRVHLEIRENRVTIN